MMGHRDKWVCGGEWGALSQRAKKILHFNPGTRRYWKNKVNRRNRRTPNLIKWAEDEWYDTQLVEGENYDYFDEVYFCCEYQEWKRWLRSMDDSGTGRGTSPKV